MATWTWNPSDKSGYVTLSSGNLTAASTTTEYGGVRCTSYKASGKWYWEVTVTTLLETSGSEVGVGTSGVSLGFRIGTDANGWSWQVNGNYGHNNSFTGAGVSLADGDVAQIALDLDNGKLWFGKNGTWNGSGDPAAGTNPVYTGISGNIYPMIQEYGTNSWTTNFGQSAFSYSEPSGFIGIAVLYDGTAETATLTDTAEALHLVDSTSETATLTDTADYLHLVDSTSETATLTDTAGRSIEATRSTSETATITDSADYLHLVDSTSETATITDAVGYERTAYGTTSETATLTDTAEALHLVDSTSETATLTDEAYADDMIRKKIKFPNLQGKHLSLTFTSADSGTFAIYYLRHKMFKSRELTSDQKHPNTQGSHIGIKLSNSGTDTFRLMYVSEKMQVVTT